MPPRKSQTRADSDKRIKSALDQLSKGEFESVREAARHNNVCHTTLLRRWKGGKSTAESREDQQHLTIPEENALVEWITHLTACGHPPRHAFIRELAEEIQSSRAQPNGDSSNPRFSLGTTWVQRFLHRHPELETTISRTIEAARIKDISKAKVNEWFDEFEKTITKYQITVENMYNMDETGFSIGCIKAAKVVVNKNLKSKRQAHPGRQEWLSVIECVCADGNAISPFVIFKGKNVSVSWIPKSVLQSNWHFAVSSKGWSNNDLAYEWLVRVFDPSTRVKANGKTRLLICDGHESHISAKFVAYCIKHNICLHLLLPHSSHLLQPLDVGVFGPLKEATSKYLNRLIQVGIARLEKIEWVENYNKARGVALTENNIRGGWRGSGLVPLNRVRVTHSLSDPTTPILQDNSITPNFEDLFSTNSTVNANTLHILNAKLSKLAIKNKINTPARRAIPRLLHMHEQTLAENTILKCRISDIEKVVSARRERKTGKRSILKGKTVISTQEILEAFQKCENDAKLKRKGTRGKMNKKQEDGLQEVESESEDDGEAAEVEVLEVVEVAELKSR